MSDGIATVADLKVVVDAQTSKLSAGLTEARGFVEQFAGTGSASLGLFDARLLAVGNTVDAVKSKIFPWIGVMQAGMGILNQLMGEAEKVANATGQADKFNELKSAANELQKTIGDELKRAFDETKTSVVGFFSAASSGSGAVSAFDRVKDVVAGALEKTISLTREFEYLVKSSIPASSRPLETLARNVQDTSAKIEDMERALAAAQSRAANAPSMVAFAAEPLAIPTEAADVEYAGIQRNIEALKEKAALEHEMLLRRRQAAAFTNLNTVDPVLNAEFEKLLSNMDKEIAALEFKTRTLGMTADAVKRLAQEEAVRAAAGEKNIAIGDLENKALAERLEKELALQKGISDFAAKSKADAKAASDAQREDNQFASMLAGIERKAVELEAKARQQEQANKSGKPVGADADLSREIAEETTLNRLKQQGIAITETRRDAVNDALDSEAEALGRVKAAEADLDFAKLERGAARDIEQIRLKVDALRLSAYETARLAQEEKLLAQARQSGGTIDDARLAQIRALATAYAAGTQVYDQARQQMELFKSTSQIVTGNLEQQFKQWTTSGKLNVQDMVKSILADMAMLTFKKGVAAPLEGLLTAGLTSAFGGFKAEGGPVSSDKAYIVGEQGPEWFVPSGNGTIIPNGVSPGAGPSAGSPSPPPPNNTTISLTVDARGATPDAVMALRAQLPAIIMNTMVEARERHLA
jgi:Lambda phage tail tape-measure protein (Tape_meas_lam_C)